MRYFIICEDPNAAADIPNLTSHIRSLDVRSEISGICSPGINLEGIEEKMLSRFRLGGVLAGGLRSRLRAVRPQIIIQMGASRTMKRCKSLATRIGSKFCLFDPPTSEKVKDLLAGSIKVLYTFPFEENKYKQLGENAIYVGSPVIDRIKAHRPKSSITVDENEINVAVLVEHGSTESKRSLKILSRLSSLRASYRFHLATDDSQIFDQLSRVLESNVTIHNGHDFDLLKVCNASVVMTRQGTLEALMMNCPQVTLYNRKRNSKLLVSGRFSYTNIIAERKINEEFDMAHLDVEQVAAELSLILEDQMYCAGMMADYQEIKERIGMNRATPVAAKIIVEWLEEDLEP